MKCPNCGRQLTSKCWECGSEYQISTTYYANRVALVCYQTNKHYDGKMNAIPIVCKGKEDWSEKLADKDEEETI